jgi:hypothetical protein
VLRGAGNSNAIGKAWSAAGASFSTHAILIGMIRGSI